MKTWYFALLSAALTLLMSYGVRGTEAVHVVIYGDAHYPPYSWEENDKVVGIYPSILHRAFANMQGYNIKMLPIPWKRGVSYLEYGKAFALFPPYLRPKERPYISYSVPIIPEQTAVLCHKNVFLSKPRERWPEDFYGTVVGRSLGYALGGELFNQAIHKGDISLTELADSHQNLMLMVANGRIDCYLDDIHAIKFELKQLDKELVKNVTIGPIISDEMAYLGFTTLKPELYPYKEDFVNQFNRAILEMQKTGEIEQIVQEFYDAR